MDVSTCLRAPLPGKTFDLVVLGGGVVGAAIARAAALADKSTLLLDQHDFASGATSRAPRGVGSVFAELERGDFSIARETLRERDSLLFERSHLVRPITGLIAVGPEHRRSKLEVRFGLWLRRRIAHTNSWRADESQLANAKCIVGLGQPSTVLPFDDAICEFPERLVAEWLREAVAAGAIVRNYSRALAIVVKDGIVRGVTVRDLCNGVEQFVPAVWVVNATGALADQFCVDAGLESPRTPPPLRAVHLVIRRFAGAPDVAIHSEDPDGAHLSLTPWNGQFLFGGVKSHAMGLPFAGPTDAENASLQTSFRTLFPTIDPDVIGAFAGPVCVPFEDAFAPTTVCNRSLTFSHPNAQHLLTALGGSLTATAAVVSECARHIGFRIETNAACAFLPGRANGVETTLQHWAHSVSAVTGLPERVAHAIAAWHGRSALCVARLAVTHPELRESLCPHTDHILAEAVDAFQHANALTLADILLRRLPVALSPCWSEECTRIAAQRIGKVLRWTAGQTSVQTENFQAERASFLVKPRTLSTLRDRLAA